MEKVQPAIAKVMERASGEIGKIDNFIRLTGGANMESWSFDCNGAGYVLRRAPNSEMMAGRAYGHDVEAALVRAAHAHGVKAPAVVCTLEPADALGTGYVMSRVEAEVNPAKILAAAPRMLLPTIAEQLVRIHSISVSALPAGIPHMDIAEALAVLQQHFAGYGGDRPIIALALRWCADNMPAELEEPTLVHGDFRMGNLMVDAEGLAAVLDWELSHLGDYHEDLAYGCMTVWGFGHMERPAFGCGSIAELIAAYEGAGGRPVDPVRLRFWLIYRTLWWALGCMQMADIWRSAADRSLERAVIGRRTSEQEIDLLLLLEEEAPEAERLRFTPAPVPAPRCKGEPSQAEMLEAISEWVAADIKPHAQGHDKFKAAVALNALGMLKREAENPVSIYDRALCDDILSGRKNLSTAGLLQRLRKMALAKLSNDVPKYAALAKAKALWLS